jgi:hypothetical protein
MTCSNCRFSAPKLQVVGDKHQGSTFLLPLNRVTESDRWMSSWHVTCMQQLGSLFGLYLLPIPVVSLIISIQQTRC